MKKLILLLTIVNLVVFTNSQAQEIDDALINAIICVESGWDSQVVSEKGCVGLMQLSKGVIEEWLIELTGKKGWAWHTVNPLDPKVNIEIGRWYINRLKDHYLKDHYSLESLLASYNWGISNVVKVNYGYKRFPHSIKRYIKNVLNIYYGRRNEHPH